MKVIIFRIDTFLKGAQLDAMRLFEALSRLGSIR